MVFLSLFLILKYIYALRLVEKWYEFAPSISMNCKESDFEGVSKGGCAIIAATTPIYNFGFAISEGTCMLCRAGGRLGDANIVESIVTGSSYVDGKVLLRPTHLLSIERADWLKLHDMFNVREAKSWQR